MEGDHVGPFNLGNPGEFTMLELAEVYILFINAFMDHRLATTHVRLISLICEFIYTNNVTGRPRDNRPKCKDRVQAKHRG